ncbi:FkbM family methyltransferase [Prosthecobacter sp.]|uniref:FkbM family methyltransferase n=1 Tax=Prosthecobacter sp. TaxID=1965333 RepID=UPI0025D8A7FB|nr:FkbM family methyltransferase [Prosthecobacter sp.]
MSLIPGDCGHRPIAYAGLYEWPVTRRVAALARTGGTLIDVGANAGYFSLLWSALHPENCVEAFEALPSNVALLEKNIHKNQLTNRIQVHSLALGKEDGTIQFSIGDCNQSGWGGIAVSGTPGAIELPLRRLDSMNFNPIKPTTIKIDCEGADSWVIEGAVTLLGHPMVSDVFFEVNIPRQDALGIKANASQEILHRLGFNCVQIGTQDWHGSKIRSQN